MKRPLKELVAIVFAGTLTASVLPASAQPAMPGMTGNAGPVEVGVVSLNKEQVPYEAELPGRILPSQVAEIRPQVSGIIQSIDFIEGSEVESGDLLYQIQSDSYQAALAVAEASLRRAEAGVPAAEATVARYERLAGGGVSESDLESARVTLLQAQADVASAQASVTEAQLNLDLTRITAPISGVIGLSSVDQGALVTANQTDALATVRQIDPVLVTLVDSSANLLALRSRLAAGTLSSDVATRAEVRLTLEDGRQYSQTGTLSQADMVVSETTGTFAMRATIANPDRLLVPGMFVRATVNLGMEEAFLVPQRAVTRDAEGNATALFVSAEGTVETRTLETSRSYQNAWVVTGGVTDGDRLIVDGLQKVSEGAEVAPVEVALDENGVITQTIESAVSAMPEGARP